MVKNEWYFYYIFDGFYYKDLKWKENYKVIVDNFFVKI